MRQHSHAEFMQYAINLAQQGLGRCAPNPSVGCVLVKDGKILAAERTADAGRPHAETQALQTAGAAAHGATAYVTLEPCAHFGQTPPCAEALIASGIAKVFIAQIDPDSRVAGKGAKMLAAAGIAVDVGLCAEQAELVNRGFFKRVGRAMPFVTVKIATDANGRYLPAKNGKPQWVTGAQAQKYVHFLRSRADAIITTSATAIADNPQLTCRLMGLEDCSPQRVLIDRNLQVPRGANLYQNPPLWVFTGKEPVAGDFSAKFFHNFNPEPKWVLHEIAREGKNHVLVEAGSVFVTALLRAGLVDELVWVRSPKQLPRWKPMFLDISKIPSIQLQYTEQYGEDVASVYIVN